MGIIDRLRAAITPASRATEMIQSPWSDNSHLGDITLESLYGLVDARPLTRNRAIKIAAVSKARAHHCHPHRCAAARGCQGNAGTRHTAPVACAARERSSALNYDHLDG